MTMPYITYIVNKFYQLFDQPTDVKWLATKRVLRYPSGNVCYGLLLQKSYTFDLTSFTNVDDRKSISAYGVYLGKSLVLWISCKQNEYRALALVST